MLLQIQRLTPNIYFDYNKTILNENNDLKVFELNQQKNTEKKNYEGKRIKKLPLVCLIP